MRILLVGQAAFGATVLERLLARSEEVVAVYGPPDGPGDRVDPLKEGAVAGNIDFYQPETYRDDQVLAEFEQLRPDLTVMAFVTDIMPARLLDVPTHGSICYHPSILPRHRGASAINWAVIMGDKQTGLSIFWADGGIDTGPVLLQKTIDIGAKDTTGSLYFNQLFPMGVDAILESIDLIKAGSAPKLVQDEAGATYEPPCDDRVAEIDWRKPAQEIHNLIRGCDPQPGAFSHYQGEMVRFYGTKLKPVRGDGVPGTVVDTDDQGISVAASGGELTIGKVRTPTHGKIPATEFAKEIGLESGDRFSD